MAWTRTDDDLCGFLVDEILQGNLIIAKDCYGSAFKYKVLVDIPGE